MVFFSFADDIWLYVEIGCPGDFDLVQANLDVVFSSICRKLMCFNASKCRISRIPNKTLPTSISEVELNGEVIERVKAGRSKRSGRSGNGRTSFDQLC